MLIPLARQARLHQTRGSFRDNDFLVRRNVIAVRMRNEGERFRIPRIEPEIVLRQMNATMITHLNHLLIYARNALPVALTPPEAARLLGAMKFCLAFLLLVAGIARAADDYRQLTEVKRLPVALDRDYQFRKTKIFFLGDMPGQKNRRVASVAGGVQRDPAIGFEGSYRLFGAVTQLDRLRRWGHYFDFFWRSKKPGPVTVRLEYQQEKLRSFTQAREVDYANARGHHKTSFTILGEDFFSDGRVLSWRCLLIANGKVVAEDRSFLWRDPR